MQAKPTVRPISGILVSQKVKKKTKLYVRLIYADTGAVIQNILSPFQKPSYKSLTLTPRDTNGDGIPDTVVLTAKKGKKTVTHTFTPSINSASKSDRASGLHLPRH